MFKKKKKTNNQIFISPRGGHSLAEPSSLVCVGHLPSIWSSTKYKKTPKPQGFFHCSSSSFFSAIPFHSTFHKIKPKKKKKKWSKRKFKIPYHHLQSRYRHPSVEFLQKSKKSRRTPRRRGTIERVFFFFAMGDSNREALISRKSSVFKRSASHAHDELQSFRSYLRWMCVDQSDIWTAGLSWSMFFLFAIIVPATSHFVLACASCDSNHARPFDRVVQLSLSSVATVSFLCLSSFIRRYGLRRFLFFDKLCDESETVRRGYTIKLNVSNSIPKFLSDWLDLDLESLIVWICSSLFLDFVVSGNLILRKVWVSEDLGISLWPSG